MFKTNGGKKGMSLAAAAILILLLSALSGPAFAENIGQDKKDGYFSAGLGLGIPYGVAGVNLEFNPILPRSAATKIHDYFSLSLGLGYSPGGMSYSVGARVYPIGRQGKWQPRVSGYYGIVALIEYAYYDDYDRVEGFAFGGGVMYRINKKFSIDLDTLYILPNNYGDSLEGGRLKLSFGGRWHFSL